VAHILSLLCKGIASYNQVKIVLGRNANLIAFFKRSIFWKQQLRNWRKVQKSIPEFSNMVETRWYSLAQHTSSIIQNYDGLRQLLAHPDANSPSKGIPLTIQNIILDHSHFKWNSMVHEVVSIIAKSIATLERTSATLADCYLEFLRVAREMGTVFQSWDLEFSDFAGHCTTMFNFRFKEVCQLQSLCVLILILH
jgi:hypothetical protein